MRRNNRTNRQDYTGQNPDLDTSRRDPDWDPSYSSNPFTQIIASSSRGRQRNNNNDTFSRGLNGPTSPREPSEQERAQAREIEYPNYTPKPITREKIRELGMIFCESCKTHFHKATLKSMHCGHNVCKNCTGTPCWRCRRDNGWR